MSLRLMFTCCPVLEMSGPLGISALSFKGQFHPSASPPAGFVQDNYFRDCYSYRSSEKETSWQCCPLVSGGPSQPCLQPLPLTQGTSHMGCLVVWKGTCGSPGHTLHRLCRRKVSQLHRGHMSLFKSTQTQVEAPQVLPTHT